MQVSLEHVRLACAIDDKHKLKLMPHLKTRDLGPNHFEKMNVASAHALLHHSTAAALRYLVSKALLPNSALTTAFFIDRVFFWFTIMTSRTRKTALSDLCPQKADDAKQFLIDFIALFSGLTIVDKTGKGAWKPVQTGAVLSTVSALALRQCYITELGFKFLMLSRLSQDALENLFSSIRFKTPVPRAREFKSTFRVIVLAQFSQPSQNGSYSIDDSHDLLLFLRDKDLSAELKENASQIVDVDDGIFELCQEEQDSLEYFSGYVAYAVIHKHKLCRTCHLSVIDSSREVPELLALKCYAQHGRNPLRVPSQPLVRLMQAAENLFRANEANLLNSKCNIQGLKEAVSERADLIQEFPPCHSVAEKALSHFFLCRLRFAVKQRNAHLLSTLRQSGKCGSKSIGMRVLSKNVA